MFTNWVWHFKAYNWLRKAADNGHSESITCLATLILLGFELPEDKEKAKSMFEQAKGNSYATYVLYAQFQVGTSEESTLAFKQLQCIQT